MTNTTDPLRALRPLREEEVAELSQVHEATQSAPLAYDVYRAGDELVIAFDAPGVPAGEIEVAVEGHSLSVGLRRNLTRGPGIDVIESGRQHGSFHQRLLLGSRWDLEGLEAHAENGVLYLRAPLVTEATSRRVQVTADVRTPSLTPPWAATAANQEEPDVEDGSVHTAA
jgi:HSP20 family protein